MHSAYKLFFVSGGGSDTSSAHKTLLPGLCDQFKLLPVIYIIHTKLEHITRNLTLQIELIKN